MLSRNREFWITSVVFTLALIAQFQFNSRDTYPFIKWDMFTGTNSPIETYRLSMERESNLEISQKHRLKRIAYLYPRANTVSKLDLLAEVRRIVPDNFGALTIYKETYAVTGDYLNDKFPKREILEIIPWE